jgi:arginine-tRNA-protein transferase
MVYSVFDPALKKRSLGKFMIMDHVKISRDYNLDYIYLGYWVDQSNKMAYKAGFQPLQYLCNGQWKDKPELNISSDSDIWGH